VNASVTGVHTRLRVAEAARARRQRVSVASREHTQGGALIARYDPQDLSRVRALPFGRWAHPYLQGFEIPPALRLGASPARAANLLTTAPGAASMSQEPAAVHRQSFALVVRVVPG